MSPDALNSLFSLCIGFAFAGALASGYQAFAERPAGFGLLQEGMTPRRFAAVPFLVFAAPFIIMRNTLRGVQVERRRVEFVMLATVFSRRSTSFFCTARLAKARWVMRSSGFRRTASRHSDSACPAPPVAA